MLAKAAPAKEGVDAGGVHDGVALAGLDSRARESHIAGELLGGERLTREGSLVDLQYVLKCESGSSA
jgi:hypothetical protein